MKKFGLELVTIPDGASYTYRQRVGDVYTTRQEADAEAARLNRETGTGWHSLTGYGVGYTDRWTVIEID